MLSQCFPDKLSERFSVSPVQMLTLAESILAWSFRFEKGRVS